MNITFLKFPFFQLPPYFPSLEYQCPKCQHDRLTAERLVAININGILLFLLTWNIIRHQLINSSFKYKCQYSQYGCHLLIMSGPRTVYKKSNIIFNSNYGISKHQVERKYTTPVIRRVSVISSTWPCMGKRKKGTQLTFLLSLLFSCCALFLEVSPCLLFGFISPPPGPSISSAIQNKPAFCSIYFRILNKFFQMHDPYNRWNQTFYWHTNVNSVFSWFNVAWIGRRKKVQWTLEPTNKYIKGALSLILYTYSSVLYSHKILMK